MRFRRVPRSTARGRRRVWPSRSALPARVSSVVDGEREVRSDLNAEGATVARWSMQFEPVQGGSPFAGSGGQLPSAECRRLRKRKETLCQRHSQVAQESVVSYFRSPGACNAFQEQPIKLNQPNSQMLQASPGCHPVEVRPPSQTEEARQKAAAGQSPRRTTARIC